MRIIAKGKAIDLFPSFIIEGKGQRSVGVQTRWQKGKASGRKMFEENPLPEIKRFKISKTGFPGEIGRGNG